jgi:hypothetical protein
VASLGADGALAVHEIASGKLLQLTKGTSASPRPPSSSVTPW